MITKLVENIIEELTSKNAWINELKGLARQDEKGIVKIKEQFAGLDQGNGVVSGYIRFRDEEHDVKFEEPDNKRSSLPNFKAIANLRLVLLHDFDCVDDVIPHLLYQMDKVAELKPIGYSLDTERIFKEETKKEELTADVNLLAIDFDISYHQHFNQCAELCQ